MAYYREQKDLEIPYMLYVRKEAALTDRLWLAICNPQARHLAVWRLRLRQFDDIVFSRNIKTWFEDGEMKVIEVRLLEKIYTNMPAFVAGLARGEPEAVELHKQYALAPLEDLERQCDTTSGMGNWDDIDQCQFLYISYIETDLKSRHGPGILGNQPDSPARDPAD